MTRFVDTSILLYAASKAPDEQRKACIALNLLESTNLALSIQVLQEFYVQVTRSKPSGSLTHHQAVMLIEAFLRFPVQELTVPIVMASLEARERYRISYWDAAIIEAARALGCRTVLSEDFGDGRDFGGITVKNPFA